MIDKITLDSLRLPAVAEPDGERQSGVWGASLTLEKGNIYLLRASSGSGKSSLCDFIFGNRTDYRGKIMFDREDIRHIKAPDWCRIRRESLAYMPQEPMLFTRLTVMENIVLKNRLTGFRESRWIADALELLEVADKRDWPVERLSVGQKQRVSAVRALCQPFDFLLLDEPVSHLDPVRASGLAGLIADAAGESGASVIVTSVGNDLPLKATEIEL